MLINHNERRELFAIIAGQIASGLVQRHTTLTAGECSRTDPVTLDVNEIVEQALSIAITIVDRIDP